MARAVGVRGRSTSRLTGGSPSRWWSGIPHAARLLGAGILAGMAAGAVAGLGSRMAMYVIRLMNPVYNGVPTHAGAQVGRFTVEGTLDLIVQGATFYGIPGGLGYLIVRRWMPGVGWRKGLFYGIFLLVVGAPAVLSGSNYEFFRYVPTAVSVGLFALLYPLYGVVVAPLTEHLGNGRAGPPRRRGIAWAGYALLGGVFTWSLVREFFVLRDVFGIVG